MPLLDNPFSLGGRSAVLTDAGSGIGRGIAVVLAGQDARVWIADVDRTGADATVADIGDRGWSAESASLDVTDPAASTALADQVAAAHGCVDIWVNNAGITADAPPSTVDDEELLKIWKANFLGVVHGSQAAARRMVDQERKGGDRQHHHGRRRRGRWTRSRHTRRRRPPRTNTPVRSRWNWIPRACG